MPRQIKQLEFKGFQKPKDWFGGSYLKKSHAKRHRPLSTKEPIHLLLRSKKAKGSLSFLHHNQFRKVNGLVSRVAKKHGIRVLDYANVGNHLHILIKLRSIPAWKGFIRELTGRLSQTVQGLGARDKQKGFWDQRPFTRIVRGWNRSYRIIKDYFIKNKLEAEGLVPRKQDLVLSG